MFYRFPYYISIFYFSFFQKYNQILYFRINSKTNHYIFIIQIIINLCNTKSIYINELYASGFRSSILVFCQFERKIKNAPPAFAFQAIRVKSLPKHLTLSPLLNLLAFSSNSFITSLILKCIENPISIS